MENNYNNERQSAHELGDKGGITDEKTGDAWMKYFKQQKGKKKALRGL